MRPKGGLADSANILMLIVGLTGGMGVGKSTVAGLLSDLGAEVVDVDALGRQILEPGGLAVSSIIDRFGPTVSSEMVASIGLL